MAIAQLAHRVRGGTSSDPGLATLALHAHAFTSDILKERGFLGRVDVPKAEIVLIHGAHLNCLFYLLAPGQKFNSPPNLATIMVRRNTPHATGMPGRTPQDGIADKLRDLRRDYIDWPQNEALTAKTCCCPHANPFSCRRPRPCSRRKFLVERLLVCASLRGKRRRLANCNCETGHRVAPTQCAAIKGRRCVNAAWRRGAGLQVDYG